jgi:hypothetical protein
MDTRTVRIDELKLLYAMFKHKKVSPVKCTMTQWLEIFTQTDDVECTSLVTRIANNLGLLAKASVLYLPDQRTYIDFKYFRQAHMLKAGANDTYTMT